MRKIALFLLVITMPVYLSGCAMIGTLAGLAAAGYGIYKSLD